MAEQASLRGRLGLALFLQSDLGNARSEFGQLLRIHRQLGSEHPGEVLGEICRRLLNDPKQYWALEREWSAYASAVNKDEDLHSDLVAARNSLTAFVVDWLERPVNSNSESRIWWRFVSSTRYPVSKTVLSSSDWGRLSNSSAVSSSIISQRVGVFAGMMSISP